MGGKDDQGPPYPCAFLVEETLQAVYLPARIHGWCHALYENLHAAQA